MREANALEKTNANRVISITQSTINELNAALSKTGKSILLTLYQTPQIQQKVLAANINTSAASLSNLLSKLEAIRPALLNIEPEGRSKYYSLTGIAEQYVCSELISKGTYHINTSFAVPADTSLLDKTLEVLYQFQKLAGSEWRLILDSMLLNGTNTNETSDGLTNLYSQLINNIKQLYLQKESQSIQKIYGELSDNTLISRLKDYLKQNLKDPHPLLPLFDLEKQNPQKAIELINYIFAEMKPQIFEKDDLSLFPNNDLPVSEEQYLAIFHRLSMMANDFFNQHETKLQILKKWEKTFSATNITLYFIAEKCNTINLLETKMYSQ